MHKLFTVAGGLVAMAGVASARLGETRAQTATRYGPPIEGLEGRNHWDSRAVLYKAQGFSIWVKYGEPGEKIDGNDIAGKSKQETFLFVQNHSVEKISGEQTRAILDSNLGSNVWVQVDDEEYDGYYGPTWRATNDLRVAHLISTAGGEHNQLIVRWIGARPSPKGF